MTLVDKALWVIERNGTADLSLVAIAAACGVSRSHLASAFGSATGWPVMKYLRARRLGVAARTLAAGAPDILAVALEAGYGSHEAFSRAFRDQFGQTPEQVRDAGSTTGLAILHPGDLQQRGHACLAEPGLVDGEAVRAIGLVRHHPFDRVIGIPIQWRDFMDRVDGIGERLPMMPTGFVLAGDEADSFAYASAVEVRAIRPVPAGLVAIEIPARRYAVFEHRDHVASIFDTYAAIWGRALPERGWTTIDGPVIERHLPDFDPVTGEGGIAIWIPLADR